MAVAVQRIDYDLSRGQIAISQGDADFPVVAGPGDLLDTVQQNLRHRLRIHKTRHHEVVNVKRTPAAEVETVGERAQALQIAIRIADREKAPGVASLAAVRISQPRIFGKAGIEELRKG